MTSLQKFPMHDFRVARESKKMDFCSSFPFHFSSDWFVCFLLYIFVDGWNGGCKKLISFNIIRIRMQMVYVWG